MDRALRRLRPGPWLCLLLAGIGLVPQAHAQPYLQELIAEAGRRHLAERPEWLSLLHYQPDILDAGYTSRADSPQFFNAPDGKINPRGELDATLTSFFAPPTAGTDEHPQCRFRARYAWLGEQLQFDPRRLPVQPCPEFDEWYSAINPYHVTLVFPSAYINNPSSMFGHTFLRIDPPPGEAATELTSYAVSFAADTSERNGLVFAVKGLTGGYPGRFSILPYYQKVNEYNDLENRDIWEYELNLSPAEVRRLLEHIWELRFVSFDYYFLDENCSFQLLAVLDVARAGMGLTAEFPREVIPTDTVRAVLAQPGLVGAVHYRPAARTNIVYDLSLLPEEQQELVYRLATGALAWDDPAVGALPDPQRAYVLELAYELVQYRYRRRQATRAASAARSLALLTARSSLEVGRQLPAAPPPATRPDQGHRSARLIAGVGRNGAREFVQLGWRPAYHDLLDRDAGHVEGAQIKFLDTAVRLEERQGARLEYLTLIDVYSVAPSRRHFRTWAWRLATGWERQPLDTGLERHLVYAAQGGIGPSLDLGEALRVYALLDGELILSGDVADHYALGAGPVAGAIWRPRLGRLRDWKLRAEARRQRYGGGLTLTYSEYRIAQSLQLAPDLALRLALVRRSVDTAARTETLLSLHRYF